MDAQLRHNAGPLRVQEFRRSGENGGNAPKWDGRPDPGLALLLRLNGPRTEIIRLSRFAAFVAPRVAKVILHCPRSLRRLLESVPLVDRVVADGDLLPSIDAEVHSSDLPSLIKSDPEVFGKLVPYIFCLRAVTQQSTAWDKTRFTVGIAWRSENPPHDTDRSIPLFNFSALAACPGVQLLSLQRNPGADIVRARKHMIISEPDPPLDAMTDGLDEVSEVIAAVDLVIAADTTVAHLAGAMGAEVWVVCPRTCQEPLWSARSEKTSWYPTMRLFHQDREGDWGEVFQRVYEQLAKRVSEAED